MANAKESVKNVIAAMRKYADDMDVRRKAAEEGDMHLSCADVAFCMREFARRLDAATKNDCRFFSAIAVDAYKKSLALRGVKPLTLEELTGVCKELVARGVKDPRKG